MRQAAVIYTCLYFLIILIWPAGAYENEPHTIRPQKSWRGLDGLLCHELCYISGCRQHCDPREFNAKYVLSVMAGFMGVLGACFMIAYVLQCCCFSKEAKRQAALRRQAWKAKACHKIPSV